MVEGKGTRNTCNFIKGVETSATKTRQSPTTTVEAQRERKKKTVNRKTVLNNINNRSLFFCALSSSCHMQNKNKKVKVPKKIPRKARERSSWKEKRG